MRRLVLLMAIVAPVPGCQLFLDVDELQLPTPVDAATAGKDAAPLPPPDASTSRDAAGEDAAGAGQDAGPGPDAAAAGPDAGPDAGAPGRDASGPGPDAASPGPDAASPGPDAGQPDASCTAGTACSGSNPCTLWTTTCPSGACLDTGTALASGAPCGTRKTCYLGTCVDCAEGDPCTPAAVCHNGRISCSTGLPQCVDVLTNKCTSGCCSATGSCVDPPTLSACGSSGNSCVACDPSRANTCTSTGCSCGGLAPCASTEVCANGSCGPIYNDFANAANWETFSWVSAGAQGEYSGGAFDGRYLYAVPTSAMMMKFDTLGGFNDVSKWTATNLSTTVTSAATGFWGGFFDGASLFLVPHAASTVVRLKTGPGEYSHQDLLTFDTTSTAKAMLGGVSDGTYAYFVPNNGAAGGGGVAARFHSQLVVDVSAAWKFYSTNAYYQGAVFDGRYVNFVPQFQGNWTGKVLRYDTAQPDFTASANWSQKDLVTLTGNAGAVGFWGGGYDGRFVYFAPNHANIFVRYDPLTDTAFAADLTTLGFGGPRRGLAFDGRYVYLVPEGDGKVARYDTTLAFTSSAAYQTYDLATTHGFWGGVFDGTYVYFISRGGTIARFKATKAPTALPSWYRGGSFL